MHEGELAKGEGESMEMTATGEKGGRHVAISEELLFEHRKSKEAKVRGCVI